jgi:hypothetical protein
VTNNGEKAAPKLKGPCAYYSPVAGVHGHSNNFAILAGYVGECCSLAFERIYPGKPLALHKQPALPAAYFAKWAMGELPVNCRMRIRTVLSYR